MSQAKLAARAVVVTGASTGIGLATTLVLAKAGYDVFAGVRSDRDGKAVVKAAEGSGGGVTAILLDVTNPASIGKAAAKVAAALKGETLFGLVNNAGIAIGGPLLQQPIEDIRRQLEVNVIGLLAVTQAFAPLIGAKLPKAARPGRIVNISSVGGKIGGPFLGGYVASKHAVEGVSESLRRELMLFGVDVIIVGPGAVATPIWDKAERQDTAYLTGTPYEAYAEQFANYMVTGGRQGLKPEAIGQVVLTALTTAKPKTRYAVVPGALMNWTLPRLLPKRTVDRLIAKRLGFPT